MEGQTVGAFRAQISSQIQSALPTGKNRLESIVDGVFKSRCCFDPNKTIDPSTKSRLLEAIALKIEDVPTLPDPEGRSPVAHLSAGEKAQAFSALQNLGLRASGTVLRFQPFLPQSTIGDFATKLRTNIDASSAEWHTPNSAKILDYKLTEILAKIPAETPITANLIGRILMDLGDKTANSTLREQLVARDAVFATLRQMVEE